MICFLPVFPGVPNRGAEDGRCDGDAERLSLPKPDNKLPFRRESKNTPLVLRVQGRMEKLTGKPGLTRGSGAVEGWGGLGVCERVGWGRVEGMG